MGDLWNIRLFGRLSVRLGEEEPVRFQTKKTASLLGYLVTRPDRDHSREHLIELLWPGGDPAQTKHRLNQALSWIRRHVPIDMDSDRFVVRLCRGGYRVDVEEYETRLREAHQERNSAIRAGLLAKALDLVNGDFLTDLAEDWVFRERDRLQVSIASAIQELVGLLEDRGDYSQAIPWAARLAEMDELDEETSFTLVRLYLLVGDERQAKRAYARLERNLYRELRISPSLGFADLCLVRQTEVVPSAFAVEDAIPFVIPQTQNSFHGRSPELTRIESLIAGGQARLITITGMGGTGKTRLALEAAKRRRQVAEDPQWFVSLAEVSDPDEVAGAILKVVGRERHPSRPPVAQIKEELARWRNPVLILDNFEHVTEAARLVRSLLVAHAGLQIIATSRHRLRLEAETEIVLKPLAVPQSGSALTESMLLFLDRASSLADRPLNDSDREKLAEICRRLEGIPLAIEIAAAWSPTLGLGDILARLDERFDFLVSKQRDIIDRHQSLRAAVDYGYRLLPGSLQERFAMLSVFRGGWTVEEATSLFGEDSADALVELTDRSLIVSQSESGNRFGMYETLREFAADQLAPDLRAQMEERHAALIEAYLRGLRQNESISSRALLDRMEAEIPNVLVALDWCRRHRRASTGIAIAVNMAKLWKSRGPIEVGRKWLSYFLDFPLEKRDRALGLQCLGSLAWIQADFGLSQAVHAEALDLFTEMDDREGMAESQFHLAIVAIRKGQLAEAEPFLQAVLESNTRDQSLLARAYLNLGNVAMDSGRRADAKAFYERCLVIEREQGDLERISISYNNLGFLAFLHGQFTLATFYLEEAIRNGIRSGNPSTADAAYANLGRIATRRGQFAKASQLLLNALEEFLKFGNKIFLRLAVVEYALLFARLGDHEEAVRHLAIADSMTETMGIPFGRSEQPAYDEAVAALAGHELADTRSELAEFLASQTIDQRLEYVLNRAKALSGSL